MTIHTIQKILSLLILVQPVCAIVLGLLCWRCPPKGPTWAFGYRSRRARASDMSWQFAQRFSGALWFCLGLILLITALVICGKLPGQDLEASVRTAILCALTEGGCILLSMIPTEILLLKKFDRFGRPRGSSPPPAQPPRQEYEPTGQVELPPQAYDENSGYGFQEDYPQNGFFPDEYPQNEFYSDAYSQDGYPQNGFFPDDPFQGSDPTGEQPREP